MISVCVFTLGCKVNQYESSVITAKLKAAGYNAFEGLKKADIFIFNTCAVTSEAERKSRQLVARATRLNKAAKVIIIGCASELNSEQFKKANNVTLIQGTAKKFDVINYISKLGKSIIELPEKYENADGVEISKIRQTIKIQDGCNNFCSYCVIPYVRGRSRSRSIEDTIQEIERVVPYVKEVILTGIDLSSYGKDIGTSLTELINKLKDVPVRLRLGSLEARAVDDLLISALKKCKNFCPHFHLSLQSGSDAVLKAMNRHYSTKEFSKTVDKIRSAFPNASITTDIIAGYPTETDEMFIETKEFVKSIGFSDMHIFPYSKREMTVSASLKGLEPKIIKGRIDDLEKIKEEERRKHLCTLTNSLESVLFEDERNGYISGYTKSYIKVYARPQVGISSNEIATVKLKEPMLDGMQGIMEV